MCTCDDVRGYALRNRLHFYLQFVLHISHAAQRQTDGLCEVDRLQTWDQLQTLRRLGVVETAIDGHQHELVDGFHVLQTVFHGGESTSGHGLAAAESRQFGC